MRSEENQRSARFALEQILADRLRYRETIDPSSPAIVLFSPSGAPEAFYAEFGWVAAAGGTAAMPGPDTMWKQEGSGALGSV